VDPTGVPHDILNVIDRMSLLAVQTKNFGFEQTLTRTQRPPNHVGSEGRGNRSALLTPWQTCSPIITGAFVSASSSSPPLQLHHGCCHSRGTVLPRLRG
jgi:hypothetical protein